MRSVFRSVILMAAFGVTTQAHAQVAARGDSVRHSSDSLRAAKSHSAVTQNIKPKGPKPARHEVSGGLRLNTNGWSVFVDLGHERILDPRRPDMFYNVGFWQLEVSEKKDAKEYKTTSEVGSGTNSYIYGKINNFYAVKLGWGFRKMIAGKPDPGCVSIHWVNAGGASLGLLKPYYLNVYSDPTAIKYEDSKSDFLDRRLIEGNAGFSKGLDEMKYIPGIHYKSAVHFDFSNNKKALIGVEAGVNIEYYFQKVDLMANRPGTNTFADLFIAVQFGKRW